MRMNLRSVAVIGVCLLMVMQNASGWNSIGHMSVAYVAYQQLTPAQKARTAALLALNPSYKKWLSFIKPGTSTADQQLYVFMMAATWPDEIKAMGSGYRNDGDAAPKTPEASANIGYSDKVMHKYWHFVDTPFSTDGTALPPIPAVNAETEIAILRAGLASDEPDQLKSYDLVWLLHLTGDVHQPLHCATRVTAGSPHGDLGGNSVVVDGPSKELHAYWDNLLGVGDTAQFAVAVKASEALPSADPTAALDLTAGDWVQESFKLAQSDVYKDPPIGAGNGPFTVTSDTAYAANSLKVAQARVALAGTRLAAVLNAELK